ncbi:zinc ribbon domain-containing protein [Ruminiclostridium herbifermentans]|uniref:Zinc ribbon domain-containing protein n=1 Tax=Ruminiclostridium herbifermentans TaxID=2488810 RepID=A0A4U7J9G1_9FIRM|nr:DUF6320 domain-containing protein [Ruminiclostridium herbifermentans]QNU66837.1 zinc ribbon domain-containing protein [Ruminiclostridium herbifermentans]
MKTCKRCRVYVVENTDICPLCKTVLTDMDGEKLDKTYPAIEVNSHKYNIIKRLFLFVSILSAVGSAITNYLTYNGVMWSAINISAIVYFWIIMSYSIKRNRNIASHILVQIICISILTVIMDNSIGYSGWSVNNVIPEIMTLANVAVLILVFINRMYWHTYVINQIVIAVCGLIPGVLWLCGLITVIIPTAIATATSLLVLVIMIIFGDKTIKSELKRRFHF